MKDPKEIVKEKYSKIAGQNLLENDSSCGCGASCCGEGPDYSTFGESYSDVAGYKPEADLGLGCGIPTDFADINAGDHVLDLGSGAGNDCFVARAIVGETGKVTGLDMTGKMVLRAKENCAKLNFKNVDFILGDIEEMPFEDSVFDVVISNCVLNLVPDKHKAFKEIFRVLRPGGHFCVSDVVIKGNLPEKLQKDAEMYAGCVSGASEINEYLEIINNNKFKNIVVHKQKAIKLPDSVLSKYLDQGELSKFKDNETGIFSITVSSKKAI